ncbi:MAG: hypothetical protein FJZ01_02665 [Candidatus Sericytochromatia bacterium]|nr:hypothetical protein [Candidatus Tanganyikabacteria bacterium]
MLKSRVLLMVIAGALGGCLNLPSGNRIGELAQGSAATGGTNNAAVTVAMQGTVTVPSSLVANNANALVGNNANALVANNANALVGNNANALVARMPGFAVMAIEEQAVAGMPVVAYNAKGEKVSDVATTDKDGKFELTVPTGSPLLIGAIAPAAKLRQLAIGYPGSSVAVSAASTFAAYRVWSDDLLTKAGKAEFSDLTRAFASALKADDLKALTGSDADLKSKANALVDQSPAVKAAAANLVSAAGSGSSTGGSGSSTGGSGSGGSGTAKVRSAITVESWPIAAAFKDPGGESFPFVKADPGKPPHVHNSPAIKSGDTVRFTIIVNAAGTANVALVGSTGSEVAKVSVGTGSGSTLPACSGLNTASCKTGVGEFAMFKLTVGSDVAKVEFSSDAAAVLTQIDVNPDAN